MESKNSATASPATISAIAVRIQARKVRSLAMSKRGSGSSPTACIRSSARVIADGTPTRRVGRSSMIFRQITHDDLGCASYLIGDEDAGVAAVVDPRFEVDEYLELARYMGVSIEHVLETHNHADHVSGHGRLAAATGATIHMHRAAEPDYEHEPFDDGWELALGALVVRALHTPGHRPEHTAFALIDTARGEEPWAVLTGDSLFVNDVARPDLAIDKAEGARDIFRSLRDQLLTLPDQSRSGPATSAARCAAARGWT